ncbi:MAG: aquaporin [bacterium]
MKRYWAELFGTFCLVFAGTGAIIVNQATGGAVSHVGVAITFGLVVMAMIYSLGDVSGAHFNPAVTFGFWAARRLPGRDVFPYVSAQILGAVVASLLLRFIFPENPTLGTTLPQRGIFPSFVLEVLMTLILMFVILSVSTGAKEKGITAGAAIGSVVALAALFGGPISGASMNPARSLGPAWVSGHFEFLWIYLLAPLVGSALAVWVCGCVQAEGCCGAVTKSLCQGGSR